jgi:hypothetical protein
VSWFVYLLTYGVCLAYLSYLVRLVRLSKINLVDFFFNLVICIIPPIYVTFYFQIEVILSDLGIQTPFLILFASFLVILFLYISRIAILLHNAEKRQTRIIEELALIGSELNDLKKGTTAVQNKLETGIHV